MRKIGYLRSAKVTFEPVVHDQNSYIGQRLLDTCRFLEVLLGMGGEDILVVEGYLTKVRFDPKFSQRQFFVAGLPSRCSVLCGI